MGRWIRNGKEYHNVNGVLVETDKSFGKRIRQARSKVAAEHRAVSSAREKMLVKDTQSVRSEDSKKRAAPWEGRGNRD